MNVFLKIKTFNNTEILLVIVLITLPIGGHAINSNAVVLFFLFSLYNFIINKPKIKFNIISLLLVFFYTFCLCSLLWTDNFDKTKTGLIRFLAFLVLPLAFAFNSDKKINSEKIINLFSKSLVFLGIYAISIGTFKSLLNSDLNFLFYHDLSRNLGDLNAIYLSVFVSLGIIFFLNKKEKSSFDIFYLAFLGLFLVLLSSKIIISTTFILVFFYFVYQKEYKKIKFKYFFLIFGVLVLFLLASNKLVKRVEVEFEKTKIDEVLYNKDFGPVYIWTGVGLRVFQTKLFFEILNEQRKVFLGFGLNNSQSSLNNKYKEYNLYSGFYYYNYHNQYLQIFAELGLVGFIILLLIFSSILKESIIYKNYFLLSFIILILVVCITESFLWRQRGMIFFIIISLLFSKIKKHNI